MKKTVETLTDRALRESGRPGPKEWSALWDEVESHGVVTMFSREGRPISFRDWVRIREWDHRHDRAYSHVARDTVGRYMISTVWLGLDHGWGRGPPLIFETMVFENGSGIDTVRYTTLEQAEWGHAASVAKYERR